MEMVRLQLGQDDLFDQSVHGGLPEGGDLTFVTKDHGTVERWAAVCITWTVRLPDGTPARAQCVTTVRALVAALAGLRGRYGDEGIVQTFDKVN